MCFCRVLCRNAWGTEQLEKMYSFVVLLGRRDNTAPTTAHQTRLLQQVLGSTFLMTSKVRRTCAPTPSLVPLWGFPPPCKSVVRSGFKFAGLADAYASPNSIPYSGGRGLRNSSVLAWPTCQASKKRTRLHGEPSNVVGGPKAGSLQSTLATQHTSFPPS